jgi:hypothetical protein
MNDPILDSINEGVFTVDHDWRISAFNHAAERITGVRKQDALGGSVATCSGQAFVKGHALCGAPCRVASRWSARPQISSTPADGEGPDQVAYGDEHESVLDLAQGYGKYHPGQRCGWLPDLAGSDPAVRFTTSWDYTSFVFHGLSFAEPRLVGAIRQ